jgi:hypothetical protein
VIPKVKLHVREELLIRFLPFMNSRYQIPEPSNPICIKHFDLSQILISVSYYPIVVSNMDTDLLCLIDHKMIIQRQEYNYLADVRELLVTLGNNVEKQINPSNICQFIPSIGIIKPCSAPLVSIVDIIKTYLGSDKNRLRLRSITRKINNGIDLISELMRIRMEKLERNRMCISMKQNINHLLYYFLTC